MTFFYKFWYTLPKTKLTPFFIQISLLSYHMTNKMLKFLLKERKNYKGEIKRKHKKHKKAPNKTNDLKGESTWLCLNKIIVLNPQLGLIKTLSKQNPMGKILKREKEYLVLQRWDPKLPKDIQTVQTKMNHLRPYKQIQLRKLKIWSSKSIIIYKFLNKCKSRIPPSWRLNTWCPRSQSIHSLIFPLNKCGISLGKTSSYSCKRETTELGKDVWSWLVFKNATLYISTYEVQWLADLKISLF